MTVEVLPVQETRDLRAFLAVPDAIYEIHSPWVPPLKMDLKRRLNRDKHPYFDHADGTAFVAWQNGRPVGRIVAHRNELHEWYHHEPVGFFGFFESIEDYEVAARLLEHALQWVRERDLERLRGPMNFSTNEECGLLIDGFQRAPAILMPYNPPYYLDFLERFGFVKTMDTWAWEVRQETLQMEIFDRLAAAARDRLGLRLELRTLNLSELQAEAETLRGIYNRAWSRNWGFVPMTRREFASMARELKPIADPDLTLIALWDGKAVGFIIGIPDINPLLKRVRGHLLPTGWWTLLRGLRRLDRFRVITLGIEPRMRGRGIDILLIHEIVHRGLRRGYREAEMSWVLETNHAMNKPLERLGAQKTKTYRILDLTW